MRCPGDQCVRASGQDDDAARIAASTSASSVADDAVVTFANPAPAAARAVCSPIQTAWTRERSQPSGTHAASPRTVEALLKRAISKSGSGAPLAYRVQ